MLAPLSIRRLRDNREPPSGAVREAFFICSRPGSTPIWWIRVSFSLSNGASCARDADGARWLAGAVPAASRAPDALGRRPLVDVGSRAPLAASDWRALVAKRKWRRLGRFLSFCSTFPRTDPVRTLVFLGFFFVQSFGFTRVFYEDSHLDSLQQKKTTTIRVEPSFLLGST